MPPKLPALPRPPLSSALLPHALSSRISARMESFRLPDFSFPQPLAKLFKRLPTQPPTWALTTALNLALDRILPRDTLQPLTGHHLQMRVIDAGLQLDFTLGERNFHRFQAAPDAKPDLIIAATVRDFIALALREEDPDTLFFSRRLRLEGDTDLGLLVKNTLDAVDWSGILERFRLRQN